MNVWLLLATHLACAIGGYLFALHPDTVKGWIDSALSKLGKKA